MVASPAFASYIPGKSKIHAMNPAAKLVSAILVAFAVMFSREIVVLVLAAGIVVAGMMGSGLPIRMLLLVMRRTIWLLVFTIVINAFLAGGERLIGFVPGLSHEGILLGLLFSAKILVLLTLMWLITATTSPLEFADSIDSFSRRFPWLHLAGLGVILSIAIRFIPFFFEEAQRLMKAQMSRGLEFSGGPLTRTKALVPILVPLLAGALRKADNLAIALEARCYDPLRRRPFVEYAFGGSELLVLGVSIGAATFAVALRFWV